MLRLLLILSVFTNSLSFSINTYFLNRRDLFKQSSVLLLPSLFNNEKPICIIGANGETGKECVKILTDDKRHVRAVDFKHDEHNNRYVENLQVDIRDSSKINDIIKETSSVIFLANAKKKYRYIKTDSEQFQNYEDIDIFALENIANACVTNNVSRLVFVSGTCKSCLTNQNADVDKICGIDCENCRSKQSGENIIRRTYANAYSKGFTYPSYTIVRIGYLFNGENRGAKEIEINQDFTKSGMISRTDLANICINTISNPTTAGSTFEAYYRDTTQPYDVKDSLQLCTNLGKSVEECFFGSEYKNKKPQSMEEVRKKPIKGSLFTSGNEYQGEDWYNLFKNVKKDTENMHIISNQKNDDYLKDMDYSNIKST